MHNNNLILILTIANKKHSEVQKKHKNDLTILMTKTAGSTSYCR